MKELQPDLMHLLQFNHYSQQMAVKRLLCRICAHLAIEPGICQMCAKVICVSCLDRQSPLDEQIDLDNDQMEFAIAHETTEDGKV